jgi:hypothetical protein
LCDKNYIVVVAFNNYGSYYLPINDNINSRNKFSTKPMKTSSDSLGQISEKSCGTLP